METLVCSSCSTKWKRQTARGRKPSVCPSCRSGEQKITKIPAKKPVTGNDELVEYLMSRYHYTPEKQTWWCKNQQHSVCVSFGPNKNNTKYPCKCKCHA